MEGKERSRRRRGGREARRRISAFLSVVLTVAMTLDTPLGVLGFGAMETFASIDDHRSATGSDADGSNVPTEDGGHDEPVDLGEGWMAAENAEYRQGQTQDVDIYVIAEDNDVAPGNTSTMRLYLKNNTGSTVTDGVLHFAGSRIKKEDGAFTDISGTGVSSTDPSADGADERRSAESTGAGEEPDSLGGERLDELEAREAAEYARDFGKDSEEGDPYRLTGLHLEPGQLHEIEFEFYTDEHASDGKAYVDFKFQGQSGDGTVRSDERFYYSIGLPTVEVELSDGQALETGVEHELSIWMNEWLQSRYEVFAVRDEAYVRRLLKELASENGSFRLLYDGEVLVGMISEWGLEKREQRLLYCGDAYVEEVREPEPAIMARIITPENFVRAIRLEETYAGEELTIRLELVDPLIQENDGRWMWHLDKKSSWMERQTGTMRQEADVHGIPFPEAIQEIWGMTAEEIELSLTIEEFTLWLFGYGLPEAVQRLGLDKAVRALQGVFLDEIV